MTSRKNLAPGERFDGNLSFKAHTGATYDLEPSLFYYDALRALEISGGFAAADGVTKAQIYLIDTSGPSAPGNLIIGGAAISIQAVDGDASLSARSSSMAISSSATGFQASGFGIGAIGTGATAAARFLGTRSSGVPTSGTFITNDFYVNGDGTILVCTAGGTPGTWKLVGSTAVSAKSANYTATVRTFHATDATSGAIAATLPAANTTNVGDWIVIEKTDATVNAVTVTRASTDTIDGATTVVLDTQYGAVQLISNGSNAWTAVRWNKGVATSTANTLMTRDSSANTAVNKLKAGGGTGTVAGQYVGSTASGSPASGTFSAGDYVVSQDGGLYVCTAGGTPGTWTVPNIPVGSMYMYGGALPNGTLACDGSAVSRTTYATLFGVIGTTFGVGDGSTTFNLPNLKDSVPVGLDSGGGFAMGAVGGSATHTHTSAAHSHALSANGWSLLSIIGTAVHQLRIPITSWTKNIQFTATGGNAVGDSGAETNGTQLGGVTDSATPGVTGSTSEYPPYQVVGFCIRYLAGPPTSGSWEVGALTIDGVAHPSISFADTTSHTALIELASATNDGITGSAAGDLVLKSGGKIRFAPDGRSTSALVIGRLGIESGATPDNKWHYFGAYGEPGYNVQLNYDAQNPNQGEFFGRGRFRLDEAGCVWIEGLLATGTPAGATIFTLPVGYRPAYRLPFNMITGLGVGKVTVDTNGDVKLTTTGAAFMSLSQISFMAEDLLAPAWTSLTGALASGWSAVSASPAYAPPRAFIDDCGDMHLSGVVTKTGTSATKILQLPAGYFNSDYTDIFLVACGPNTDSVVRIDIDATGAVTAVTYKNSGVSSGYVSLEGIVLPCVGGGTGSGGAWQYPTKINSWADYDASHTVLGGYSVTINKNGIVSLRGTIKSGTAGGAISQIGVSMQPKSQLLFLVECQTGVARSDVCGLSQLPSGVGFPGLHTPAGTFYNSGTNGYVSASGIRWNSKMN